MSDRRNTSIRFDTPSEFETILLARAARYRLLARLLSDPLQGPRATETDVASAEAASIYLGDVTALPLLERVRQTLPANEEDARALHTELFGVTAAPQVPPYEVEYDERTDLFWRTRRLADVSAYYRAFGLQVRARERPDHVSVETDFLWFLLERIAAARSLHHGRDREGILEDGFVSFFREHFNGWAGSFATALRDHAGRRGNETYTVTAGLLVHVLESERAILGLDPCPGRSPNPAGPAEEDCDGCPLTNGGG